MTSHRVEGRLQRAQEQSKGIEHDAVGDVLSDGKATIGAEEALGIIRILTEDGYGPEQRASVAAALDKAGTPEAKALLAPFLQRPAQVAMEANQTSRALTTAPRYFVDADAGKTMAQSWRQALAVIGAKDAPIEAKELAHLSVMRIASTSLALGVPLAEEGISPSEVSRLGAVSLRAYLDLKATDGVIDGAPTRFDRLMPEEATALYNFIVLDKFVTPEEQQVLEAIAAHKPRLTNEDIWGSAARLASSGRTSPEDIANYGKAFYQIETVYPLLRLSELGKQAKPEEYTASASRAIGEALKLLGPLETSGSSLEMRVAALNLHETALDYLGSGAPAVVAALKDQIRPDLATAHLALLDRLLKTAPPTDQGRSGWLFRKLELLEAKKDTAGAAAVRKELGAFYAQHPSVERYQALIDAWQGRPGADKVLPGLLQRLGVAQRQDAAAKDPATAQPGAHRLTPIK